MSANKPTKTELGKISKVILQEICKSLRTFLNINHWQSSNDCIRWFKNDNKDGSCSFIRYDIKDYYPSITEDALNEAFWLAKEYIQISDDKTDLIRHWQKTLLFHNNVLWIKKDDANSFDNPMGAYDGAEVCELVIKPAVL